MTFESSFAREFAKGINEFNKQEFFQCHETLEQLWKRQIGPEREFLQGVIQVAVAYHHLANENFVGADKLLRSGLRRLTQFEPTYLSIDVTGLAKIIGDTLEDLQRAEKKGSTTSYNRPKIKRWHPE